MLFKNRKLINILFWKFGKGEENKNAHFVITLFTKITVSTQFSDIFGVFKTGIFLAIPPHPYHLIHPAGL